MILQQVQLPDPHTLLQKGFTTQFISCVSVGKDYFLQSESLVFLPGQSSATLTVGVMTDSVVELTERFLLTLTSTNNSRVVIEPGRKMTAVEILDTSGEDGDP